MVPSNRVTLWVNIRDKPESGGQKIGRLRPKQSLPFVANISRWREVRLAGGSTGFVSKSWTAVSPNPAPPSSPVAGPAFPAGVEPRRVNELRIHYLNVGNGT